MDETDVKLVTLIKRTESAGNFCRQMFWDSWRPETWERRIHARLAVLRDEIDQYLKDVGYEETNHG